MSKIFEIWTWLKENWIFGAIAWGIFFLSLAVTVILFLPLIVLLSFFGFDLVEWSGPFDQMWNSITLNTANGRFVVFSLVCFPFVFRNFLKFMAKAKELQPSDWNDQ